MSLPRASQAFVVHEARSALRAGETFNVAPVRRVRLPVHNRAHAGARGT